MTRCRELATAELGESGGGGFMPSSGARGDFGAGFSSVIASLSDMLLMMIMNEHEDFDPLRISCVVSARVLEGNSSFVGEAGGFSGDTVGNVLVEADSAAVDPFQFGGKGALRQIRERVSGRTAGGQIFDGISDIIGEDPQNVPSGFSNIREFLRDEFPNKFLLELVTGEDEGISDVFLEIEDPSFDCTQLTR